jgi:hypothetical protein
LLFLLLINLKKNIITIEKNYKFDLKGKIKNYYYYCYYNHNNY